MCWCCQLKNLESFLYCWAFILLLMEKMIGHVIYFRELNTFETYQNLILLNLFCCCSRMGGGEEGKKASLPKICHTYPTMMKLGIVITYLKKNQKIYESSNTLLQFSWRRHFLPKINRFSYIKKYKYRLQFDT